MTMNMAIHSRSSFRFRGNQSHHRHRTVDSSESTNRLYVETNHATTPQSQALPPLSSAPSYAKADDRSAMPMSRARGDNEMTEWMERGDRKDRRNNEFGSQERGAMSYTPQQQQQQQQQQDQPQQRQFFATPRVVEVPSHGNNVYGSITMDRSEEEEDSRNPPHERERERRPAASRPVVRTDHGNSFEDARSESNTSSYDDFSAKMRNEMRKLKADALHGNNSNSNSGNKPPPLPSKRTHANGPEALFRESASRPPIRGNATPQPPPKRLQSSDLPETFYRDFTRPVCARENNDKWRRPSSTTAAETSRGSKVNLFREDHHGGMLRRTEEENSRQELAEKKSQTAELRRFAERNQLLEQELAEKKSQLVDLRQDIHYHENKSKDYEQQMEHYQRGMQRSNQLEQVLAEKDMAIIDLTRQLQDMQDVTEDEIRGRREMRDEIANERAHLDQRHAQDMEKAEEEYKAALEDAMAENEMLQKELVMSQRKAREENELLQKELEASQRKAREEETSQRKVREENEMLRKELETSQRKAQEDREALDDAESRKEEKIHSLRSEIQGQLDELRRLQNENGEQTEEIRLLRNESQILRDENSGELRMLQEENQQLRAENNEEVRLLRNENESIRKENEDLKDECEIATREAAQTRQAQAESQSLRNENNVLRREKETLRNDHELADQDVKMSARIAVDMEAKCEDAVQEQMRLETVAEDMRESYKQSLQDKVRCERVIEDMNDELAQLKIQNEHTADMKMSYKQLLQDKEQCGRMIEDLKNDLTQLKIQSKGTEQDLKLDMARREQELKLDIGRKEQEFKMEKARMERECSAMKGHSKLLDEMTDAVEVALDEKEDILRSYDDLSNQYAMLQKGKDSREHSLQVTIDDINASFESTKKSMSQALSAALSEKEEFVHRYNELLREHTRLQSTKDSESHMTEMVTRQRDKMSAMMDRYQMEMDNLKTANRDLLDQRDDLKEELISVLETASVYQH